MAESPNAIFSVCIHTVCIIWLLTERKGMSPSHFLAAVAKHSPHLSLSCSSSFCFQYYSWATVWLDPSSQSHCSACGVFCCWPVCFSSFKCLCGQKGKSLSLSGPKAWISNVSLPRRVQNLSESTGEADPEISYTAMHIRSTHITPALLSSYPLGLSPYDKRFSGWHLHFQLAGLPKKRETVLNIWLIS